MEGNECQWRNSTQTVENRTHKLTLASYNTAPSKQWKYDSIPHMAYVMLVVYDVWHHHIWKLSISSKHTQKKSQRFKNLHSGESVWKYTFSVTIYTGGKKSPFSKQTRIRVDVALVWVLVFINITKRRAFTSFYRVLSRISICWWQKSKDFYTNCSCMVFYFVGFRWVTAFMKMNNKFW